MCTKSALKWYRFAKEVQGGEIGKVLQGQESVRLMFRLRTGSAGLLEDEKRCRMVSSEKYVGVGEDVAHFLVGCMEFEGDRWCG